MALMNPQIPAPGTESQAEIQLFWALEKLPSEYRVYHSVKWYFGASTKAGIGQPAFCSPKSQAPFGQGFPSGASQKLAIFGLNVLKCDDGEPNC